MINLLFSNEAKLNGFYLRAKDRHCSFKGVEINLSPELYKAFLAIARNPKEYQRLDDAAIMDDIMTEKERTNVRRTNKEFRESGLIKEPIIKSKMRVGYRLNLNFANNFLIKIED